ncbi:D-alanyl-D-alanine carboxypeptidase family protein [Ferviditalea candida]|uniref:serine-type D-Ala-D-Ala carboxypeptidase n=1 Tax=Ferviditalea candida TaxID=3108399 RepID=A0ABU5ZMJ2_9BACL|nr:D-alanyl-D-alanine carboxypeptidase family protein [Paenibacillaceae bacterium T2]
MGVLFLRGFQRRKKMLLMIFVISLVLQTASFLSELSAAEAAPLPGPSVEAKSAVLIDAGSGQVLYQMNPDQAYPPASMAKMMTEYIVMDYIKSGKIKWTDQVTVSKYAAGVGGSGGLLAAGETYTVEDMFKAMSIYSSNDASVVLAEYVGGTVEKFAALMNQKAKELGLSDKAHFIDPTGLSRKDLADAGYNPASLSGETEMTAMDAARLAYNIVNNHPEALAYTSTPTAYLKPNDERYKMINWNHMLAGWKDYNNNFSSIAYPGMDGLKTGHTDEAGWCFTGTALHNGFRLISVVMGTIAEGKRFSETRKLLDYGFNNFERKTVLTAKTQIDALKQVEIKKGNETVVPVVTEKGAEFVVQKGENADAFDIKAQSAAADKLVAPIKKGDVLGTVTITYKGAFPITKTVNLVAAENVDKASWFRLFFRGIKNFIQEMFAGIKNLF